MGIPGFNSWFRQNNARAHVPLKRVRLDHIYIDMNSVLHLVLRRAKNMDHFHALMFGKLDSILTIAQPRKSVLFALDGPAPLAKLLTQRSRRKKMSMTNAQASGKVVPAIAITPGTPFMQEVSDSLQYYICQRLIGSKFSHLQMELSGATVKGEGEVKILSRLQRPLENVLPTDTHAMIGNDSDLFIMALLSDSKHVHVLSQILSSYHMPSAEEVKIFSVDKLHEHWRSLGPPPIADPDRELARVKGLKQDLALTCILSRGNDYLPAVAGLSSSGGRPGSWDEGLWRTYLKMRKEPMFMNRSLMRKNKKNLTVLDEEFLMALVERNVAGRQFTKGKDCAYIKAAEPGRYLDGLCWVMDMYHGGVCPDYRFLYDGLGPSVEDLAAVVKERKSKRAKSDSVQEEQLPKSGNQALGPSSPKDLQKRSQQLQQEQHPLGQGHKTSQNSSQKTGNDIRSPNISQKRGMPDQGHKLEPKANIDPLSPAACALALLPKEGQGVIPKSLQFLMDAGSPIQDMYVECEVCLMLSAEASTIAANITALSRKKLELEERISILQKTSPRQADALREELEKAKLASEEWRSKARANHAARDKHMTEAHPYEPFPVHRIEQAVQSVPISDLTTKERELVKFGSNFIYKRLERGLRQNLNMQPPNQGRNNWKSRKRQKLAQVTSPPSPPSSKFKHLKGPLPIQRSLQAGDEPGKVFMGRLARGLVSLARRKL